MRKSPTVAQVAVSIELIVRFFGWGVLFGRTTPPTVEEIEALFLTSRAANTLGERVTGGKTTHEAERIVLTKERAAECIRVIEAVGGWELLIKSVQEVKKVTSNYWWRVVTDYVNYIKPGGMIHAGARDSMAGLLFGKSGKYALDQRSARRWSRKLFTTIATQALSFPNDGSFDLSPEPLKSACPD